jgi:hypothetical protein
MDIGARKEMKAIVRIMSHCPGGYGIDEHSRDAVADGKG